MGITASHPSSNPLRVLVAIASYGVGNDGYLRKIIEEYRSMDFAMDIVVLSNISKAPAPDVECRVGLPTKDPWSLPFGHKKLFVERSSDYDLFIYSEDDILLTERSLRAWIEVNGTLAEDEIPGFLRIEYAANGEASYPDAHAWFHWETGSVRRRGEHTLAYFTNEHAACYVLTRAQLERAVKSGGFDVPPHQEKYDLLCTAATDPYTQCGLTKLIPISRLEDFSVHHMSNRYAGKMGPQADEFHRQTEALVRMADGLVSSRSLMPTETRLRWAEYSKDYYEPLAAEVMNLIPTSARSVLSIGCGSGATEIHLADKGLRVAAFPLDYAISSTAADRGVKLLDLDLVDTYADGGALPLEDETFDCVLCLNVLHLAAAPAKVLRLARRFMHERSTLVIRSPNMVSLPAFKYHLIETSRPAPSLRYAEARTHFSSVETVRNWCVEAGFRLDSLRGVAPRRKGVRAAISSIGEALPGGVGRLFANSIVAAASVAPAIERDAA